MRMPEMSGLETLGCLLARGFELPVIMLSGHADVALAVHAVKAGAFDFIEKPFRQQDLLDRITRALELDTENRRNKQNCSVFAELY